MTSEEVFTSILQFLGGLCVSVVHGVFIERMAQKGQKLKQTQSFPP
jgi:hypothetical protein